MQKFMCAVAFLMLVFFVSCNNDRDWDLFSAAQAGKFLKVKSFIKQGADVNAKEYGNNKTALHYAAKKGNFNMVKFLVENKADIDAMYFYYNKWGSDVPRNSYLPYYGHGVTALHFAIDSGNIRVVEYLLSKGAKIDTENSRLVSMNIAVESGNLGMVKYLISKGATFYNGFWADEPSIEVAIRTRHLDIVKYFIEKKCVDIHSTNFLGNSLFYRVVESGDINIVKYFVKHGADVNLKSKYLILPLTDDFSDFKFEKLNYKSCMRRGIDLKTIDLISPLHIAVKNNDYDLVQYLISKGAGVNATNSFGDTPLHWAMRAWPYREWSDWSVYVTHYRYIYPKIVEYLVSKGANVNAVNNDEVSPLFLLIYRHEGDSENTFFRINWTKMYENDSKHFGGIIYQKSVSIWHSSYLIIDIKGYVSNRVDFTVRDKFGNTALLLLLKRKECDIGTIEYILYQDIDVNAKDIYGNSALSILLTKKFYYREEGNACWEVLKMLLKNGAKFDKTADYANEALFHAVISRNVKILEYILSYGVNVNTKNNNGNTALAILLTETFNDRYEKGNVCFEILKLLLKNGAKFGAKADYANEALFHAVGGQNYEILEYLVSHGVNVNARDSNGNTALHWIAFHGYFDMAKYLVSHGVNIKARIRKDNSYSTFKKGMTAEDIARDRGYTKLAEYIKSLK